MNSAHITGPASAIYGVGPTGTTTDRTVSQVVSTFCLDVREAVRTPGRTGGTHGLDGYRYVVGGFADAVVLKFDPTPAGAMRSAVEFATANRPILAGTGLGWWLDERTGRIWLDVVRGFDHVSDAVRAARANGEIAAFDRETGEAFA